MEELAVERFTGLLTKKLPVNGQIRKGTEGRVKFVWGGGVGFVIGILMAKPSKEGKDTCRGRHETGTAFP